MATSYKNLVRMSLLIAAVGCGDAGDGDEIGTNCEGAKCDNASDDDEDGPNLACDDAKLLKDLSGKELSFEDILKNTDPIAQLVLNAGAERCPMSVADIVEQLLAGGCTDHRSQFVSERSQLLNTFLDYRAVTQLKCPDGQMGERQVFLHFPIMAAQVEDQNTFEIIKDDLEAALDHTFPAIIAENTDGIFNFYQSRSKVNRVCSPPGGFDGPVPAEAEACDKTDDCEGAAGGPACERRPDALGVVADFRFFGNSIDFVNLPDRAGTIAAMADALITGPVTTEADIEHSLDVERNCAVCHPNGGLTMRELVRPWVHWEADGHFTSPQTDALIAEGGETLGNKSGGEAFEQTVNSGNQGYLDARLRETFEIVDGEQEGSRTVTTGQILRPLFCTDEFNLRTTGRFPNDDLTLLPMTHAVVDDAILPSGPSLKTDHVAFQKRIGGNGGADWQLWGFGSDKFAGVFGQIPRETIGTFTFIERAQIDRDYQERLMDRKIVDAEFVADVLSIDFTRAVFSEERCGLVKWLDRVDPSVFIEDANPRDGAPELLRTALIQELCPEQRDETCNNPSLSPAERDFANNLIQRIDPADPFAALDQAEATAQEFANACTTRNPDEMLGDYVRYIGQVRKRAGHREIAEEHGETAFLMFRFPGFDGFGMPEAQDQEFSKSLRFDPRSCELINEYPSRE